MLHDMGEQDTLDVLRTELVPDGHWLVHKVDWTGEGLFLFHGDMVTR